MNHSRPTQRRRLVLNKTDMSVCTGRRLCRPTGPLEDSR